MIEERYDIGGMHCAACSSAVERVTRKLPGVTRSEVNLPMNRLTIQYEETETNKEAIIKKIEKAGFSATLHTENPVVAEVSPEATAKKEKRSLIASLILATALLIVSMGQMLFPTMPLPDIISIDSHPSNFALIQLLLTIPVLVLGKKFFIGGFSALFHGSPNMDSLVALSASASFLYSIAMTFLIPDNAHYAHMLYYESAAVVVALVSVGKYLEARNKEKTKDAIEKLMALSPDTAILLDENGQWEVPTESIKVGDTLLIKAGANIPLDGYITDGTGSVNEAMLTGESLPVTKSIGDTLIGGSLSVDGTFKLKVTHIGKDTALSKIIAFVEDAQGKKAPISKLADQISGVFVPVVMAIATIAAIIWLLTGAEFSFALRIFTSVLVIACPCALGLATPTAIIVATGLGAKKGILIRNGEALESAHKINLVIFDKTGTITLGKPRVTEILGNPHDILQYAYALESFSDHPLAEAICEKAKAMDIEKLALENFQNHTGRGLSGTINGDTILAGSPKMMAEHKIDLSIFEKDMAHLESQGKTLIALAKNGKALGLMALGDTIREESPGAIKALKAMGIESVLLTGDNKGAAQFIASKASIDQVVAEVLPTEKAAVVEKYQKEGYHVMMVGDGINDAPALTQANIGCAIGSGSDIAIDAAEIVLMGEDLHQVSAAIKLSRLSMRNIKQNLFWAFCYNTLGIPIAAGLLYPSFGLLLSPMIGAFAMSLSSLFVVGNALKLKTKQI